MSSQPDAPLVEHRDEVDLPARPHVEDVIFALRKILAKPLIQEVRIGKKKPIEVVWLGLEEDTLDFDLPDPEPSEAVRELDLEELTGDGTAEHLLGRAVLHLEKKGLAVSHAVVGTETLLWDWLKLDLRRMDVERPKRLMGGLLVATPKYRDHLLILVGSPSSVSPLADAVAAVKIVMTAQKEVPT